MSDVHKIENGHIAFWPPYGSSIVPVQHVEALIQSGLMAPTEPQAIANVAGNFLAGAVDRGNVLYMLSEGFDGDDLRLAITTLDQRAATAKRQRVLDALSGH